MRAAIGDLMAKSKREIPHYYLTQNIDLRTAMEWMREVNAGRGAEERLVPAALLLKAVAKAVREGARGQRLLHRRRVPPRRGRAPGRRGLAARRRPGRAGDPRRRHAAASTT